MKNPLSILFYLFLLPKLLTAQELPEVIPPSPTVASLMRYEDIPVSNYTGVPNISIPLSSSQTRSKDINFNIGLSYHIAGINADEQASDVGLGWSLLAGGTISRTVKDIPDEYYLAPISNGISPSRGKIGIYHNTQLNNTNDVIKLIEHLKGNVLATQEERDKFLWEDGTSGKYDSEYDTWQYNFMGYSGSFIIQKNYSTNQLQIKNLSPQNKLVIENVYDQNSFVPTSFIVYDDLGYKYIFDIKEFTTLDSYVENEYYGIYTNSSLSLPIEYYSSFHLSAVYDNNNNEIISLSYNNDMTYEVSNSYSYTFSWDQLHLDMMEQGILYNTSLQNIINGALSHPSEAGKLQPSYTTAYNKTTTRTKKIQYISIDGYATYEFFYDTSRLDFSETDKVSAKLISINQKDYNGNMILQWDFDYFYNDSNYRDKNKLFLQSVTKKGVSDSEEKTSFHYDFSYNPSKRIGIDYWGYHKALSTHESQEFDREATVEHSTLGILEKISYPTGGGVKFHYEPNTYSYIGDVLQTNFDENPMNWQEASTQVFFNSLNQQQALFTINEAQDVRIIFDLGGLIASDYRLLIYKLNGNSYEQHTSVELSYLNDNGIYDIEKPFEPGVYKVSMSSVDLSFPNNFSVDAQFFYKNKLVNQKQFLIGGGNRIKQIDYLTNSDSPLEDDIAKSVSYSYSKTDTLNLSSGSLAYVKPVLEYDLKRNVEIAFVCQGPDQPFACKSILEVDFRIRSFRNQNFNFKTAGADIGYKNVTIEEIGNGKSIYEYTSPIDTPEYFEAYNISPPFLPSQNFDYKRGLLENVKIYDNYDRLIKQIDHEYEIIEENTSSEQIVGFISSDEGTTSNNCVHNYLASDYPSFMSLVINSSDFSSPCTQPNGNFVLYPIRKAYGYTNLINKSTKDFFYGSDPLNPEMISVEESFTYNPTNNKIKTNTVVDSEGSTLKTEYFYDSSNSIHSQNRISELKQTIVKKDGQIINNTDITFGNNWAQNDAYLPQEILAEKNILPSPNTPENKVNFHDYDSYGNPKEISKNDGVRIIYVWGYNLTQPIAKIENASYDNLTSLQEAAIDSAVLASNSDVDDSTEANLRTNLESLRQAFTSSIVTGYTYDPLIGITSVIDPKGYIVFYEYDDLNRLIKVKDKDGNLLNENKYHYLTEN